MGRITVGKDGFPVLPGRGATAMMLTSGGARMNANRQTMAGLAEMLSGQLDLPVVDMTGLTGKYDYTLSFSREGLGGMRLGAPPPLAAPPPGEGGGGMPTASTPDGESSPSLFTALQEQLGLKLEQRKGPVDLLVIDHLEKAPIEN
jgi:uncharacterized protein (TIGR03435 family)